MDKQTLMSIEKQISTIKNELEVLEFQIDGSKRTELKLAELKGKIKVIMRILQEVKNDEITRI